MDTQQRKRVATELFAKIQLTREQYDSFKGLAEDIDLDVAKPEEPDDWESIAKSLENESIY